MKTCELSGKALDWAVALADGLIDIDAEDVPVVGKTYSDGLEYEVLFAPSTEWAHGGLIVERMLEAGLLLQARPEMPHWAASVDSPNRFVHGPTALIAAMRCHVARKLGDEVEVPETLR